MIKNTLSIKNKYKSSSFIGKTNKGWSISLNTYEHV